MSRQQFKRKIMRLAQTSNVSTDNAPSLAKMFFYALLIFIAFGLVMWVSQNMFWVSFPTLK